MAKQVTWNGRAVIEAVGRVKATALRWTAQDIQRAAKSSMKKKKKLADAAPPGSPPHAHTGALKNSIRYAWDDRRRTIVVGPVKHKGRSQGAKALESGGMVRVKVRQTIETGAVGDRRYRYSYYTGGGRGNRRVVVLDGRRYRPMSERSEAERVAIENYYDNRRSTRVVWRTVKMAARPAMTPAMKREIKKMGDRLRRAAAKFKR